MFQPDVLLPTQFFAAARKRVPQEAEYRLILAVLQDAIECFQKHLFARDAKARQLFEDAESWIVSDDRVWPYSFLNICDILNIDPDYVREGLRVWQERQCSGRERPRPSILKPRPIDRAAPDDDRAAAAS